MIIRKKDGFYSVGILLGSIEEILYKKSIIHFLCGLRQVITMIKVLKQWSKEGNE